MAKRLLIAGALMLAAGCGSHSSPAAEKTPTPAISWDQHGSEACAAAEKDAWLAALESAKLSGITELQDLALREERLGNHDLIKNWCQQHFLR